MLISIIIIIIIIAARCRWFMPIILAEIRMIAVQGQPGFWRPHLGKKKKPSQNRTGGVARVVERLPSKREAVLRELCSHR
jgi:hypothetical protein